MRMRGDRALKDLYDRTKKIKGPEITPVLEGSCRIQGPVEESEHELQSANSAISTNEKRYSGNKSFHSRVESGTCNVCSAPCSSCMHFNRAASAMESNIEGCISVASRQRKETESSSSVVAGDLPIYKSRACDDLQHTASETSNTLGSSSSHDTYSENAQSKATLTVTHDPSEDVDMPPNISSGETMKEDQCSQKETNDANRRLPSSSYSHEKCDLHPLTFSRQAEKQCRSECQGNNVSCISGDGESNASVRDPNMVFVVKDAAICLAKEIGDESLESDTVCQDPLIEESHDNSLGPSPDPLESSANASFAEKFDPAHHCSLEDKPLMVEPSDYSIDITYSSLRAKSDSNAENFTTLPDYEESKACRNTCNSSAENVENTSPSQKVQDVNNSEMPPDEVLSCGTSKGFLGRSSSISNTGIKVSQPQSQPTTEADNSGSDIEDDVKVCDICGDAGREESLAVCSRCSDGAEHTYCTRIMLDKIPEGDWLCEECKLKEETENQESDKSEAVSGTSKMTPPKENNLSAESIFNPKILPKLDTKLGEMESRRLIKGLHSPHISMKRDGDNLEPASLVGRKSSESSGGPKGAASPIKKPVLSRESSLKNLDKGKAKPANLTAGSQLAKSSQDVVRPQTSAISNPPKPQGQAQMPRGLLSKTLSFNCTNMKGKVKQLIEPVPSKHKTTRDLASKDTKKDGLVKTLNKAVSFSGLSSGRSNIESANKTQSLNSPRAEDSKGLKQVKERHVLEKKNSFILDRPVVSPSLTAGMMAPLSRTESKVVQPDGKIENIHESGINIESDGTNNFGRKEVVKQPLYKSKFLSNHEGQKPCQVAHKDSARSSTVGSDTPCSQLDAFPENVLPQTVESAQRDDKVNDPSLPISSRPSVSVSSRALRNQRSNEAGHATEFCSSDKLRTSALKHSERSLNEGFSMPNKWKHAVEATISVTRIQKNSRLRDQSAELNSELSGETASKLAKRDVHSIFSSRAKNLDSFGGAVHGQEISGSSAPETHKTIAFADGKHKAVLPMEAESVALAGASHFVTTSNELIAKPVSQALPHSPANSSTISAIPELEFIWQGDFEVMRSGRLPELFDGVQAHLSMCASPKVLEAVSVFPFKVKLEQVPCQSLWPPQFHGTTANEDNIALFFFAKDIKSYEKSYKKLLENMVDNDLALKGNIDGVELLIFSSNKLPEKSQRWNRLFFLWGTFRGRSVDCFETLPNSLRKSYGSTLDLSAVIQDSSSPVISEVSMPQKSNLNVILDKGVSKLESPTKMKDVDSDMNVELDPAFSSGTEDRICQPQVSPVHVCQRDFDNKQPSGSNLHINPSGCSSKTVNELSGEPRININTTQLTPQSKSGAAFLEKVVDHLDDGRETELPAHVHTDCVRPTLTSQSILPPRVVSTSCRKVVEETGPVGILNEASTREKEIKEMPIKVEAALCNDLHERVSEIDPVRWESRLKRKSSSSCSMDTISQASGETSRSTDETALWKDRVGYPVLNGEREQKKMKLFAEGHASSSSSREESMVGRFSSKVHPFLNEQEHGHSVYDEAVMPESSRSDEKPLFVVDLGPVRDAKTDVIHVLSSDDEEPPESNAPDLELALGGKKKSPKKDVLPFMFPLADRKNNQDNKVTVADADDASASLSLSLAFPLPEERPPKPVPKPEQFLPERPCVDTSLLLFGRFTGT